MILWAQGIWTLFNSGLYSFSEESFAGKSNINRILIKIGALICGASRFSCAVNGQSINGDEWKAIGTAHHADGGLTG